jgi:NADH-quinone oxidoreductase subunit G
LSEAARKEFVTESGRDVDLVLSTEGLVEMIDESGLVFNELDPEAFDMPFGLASGAGVIFGVTGGVTEAVLRKVAHKIDPKLLSLIPFSGIRGNETIKEAAVTLGGREVRIAVVHGLANAEILIQRIKSGEAKYDIVEVMACPEGCISGAGQPLAFLEQRKSRAKGLYTIDKMSQIKSSDENPMMESLYRDIIKDKNHELLHVHYGG